MCRLRPGGPCQQFAVPHLPLRCIAHKCSPACLLRTPCLTKLRPPAHRPPAAMEMSQMVTQALWQRDPVLMQLPHFSRDLATACAEKGEGLVGWCSLARTA